MILHKINYTCFVRTTSISIDLQTRNPAALATSPRCLGLQVSTVPSLNIPNMQ